MKCFIVILFFLCFGSAHSFSQTTIDFPDTLTAKESHLRVVFYNIENLFDYEDDSLTADEEFTPEGDRHWNKYRYEDKLKKTGKTLLAIGEWEPPAIVAFCEIENRKVLEDLLYKSCLYSIGYKIIHFNSGDRRGIDVGLIYRPDLFHPISQHPIRINHPFFEEYPTRDILYAKGTVPSGDTLHLFVNHWPSKRGNSVSSAPRREAVARVLRAKVDSIKSISSQAHLLIMGDFNDSPSASSVSLVAGNDLVNLMEKDQWQKGTHGFEGRWEMLDQFIVSKGLVEGKSGLRIRGEKGQIFEAEWLLKENANGDQTTNRTFQGPAYKGGFSDHLPIYLDLEMLNK
ncbi:hypothetical protein R9C00_25385 [Flammeovirgaceae bacterium SG7u.111]|nr:hypothetical protein [Flammeovirgaceae bacterium SG7u.132]WPO35030.1 hypothetical protein R9C00_25385 [Flammeovirgaceae bacterium SG7u.111]